MAEIKLNKRYKYAGDIFPKLIDIGFDIETATSFLNDIKDADVVEVVRCRDCIFYQANSCFNHQWDFESSTEIPLVRENDYCSYGERTPQKEG